MVVKYGMAKAKSVAKTLLRSGWHANVSLQSDGSPVVYVRGCDFDKLLLEAVDEGLSSLYGPTKGVVYSLLENSFNVSRLEIPSKIKEFADAIERIFGFGAKTLEVFIMERLNEKVGLIIKYPQELEDLKFTNYVMAARKSFLMKKDLSVQAQQDDGRKVT